MDELKAIVAELRELLLLGTTEVRQRCEPLLARLEALAGEPAKAEA